MADDNRGYGPPGYDSQNENPDYEDVMPRTRTPDQPGPRVTMDLPPEETQALRPVQMRMKPSASERRGPRVSLYTPTPATPRVSYMPKELPSFWSQFNLKTYMDERKVHPLAWVVFGFLVLGIVIIIVTFAAPGWAQTLEIRQVGGWFEGEMYGYYGLWYACWSLLERNEFTITSCELMADLRTVPGWFKGVQAMGALSLLSAAAAMMAVSIYIFSKKKNEKPTVMLTSMIFCTATGLCTAVQFVVFAILFLHNARWCCSQQAQVVEWKLQYCFVLTCVATVVFWAAAVTSFFERRRIYNRKRNEQYLERLQNARMDDGNLLYY